LDVDVAGLEVDFAGVDRPSDRVCDFPGVVTDFAVLRRAAFGPVLARLLVLGKDLWGRFAARDRDAFRALRRVAMGGIVHFP